MGPVLRTGSRTGDATATSCPVWHKVTGVGWVLLLVSILSVPQFPHLGMRMMRMSAPGGLVSTWSPPTLVTMSRCGHRPTVGGPCAGLGATWCPREWAGSPQGLGLQDRPVLPSARLTPASPSADTQSCQTQPAGCA